VFDHSLFVKRTLNLFILIYRTCNSTFGQSF